MKRLRPAVLCILDGWGFRVDKTDNAIAAAATPNYTKLLACPHALLQTSGSAVGLPPGQMGNSEVGHMNIGAGRIVSQDLPRIDAAVANQTLGDAPAFQNLIAQTKASGGVVHLMGLMSPGGVHSHQAHIAALARVLSDAGLKVCVHAFLDGRDTPPRSAIGFVHVFERAIAGLSGVKIATVMGRYYAMDRDKRWDRVQKAYDALVDANGDRFETAAAAIEASYAREIGDEFVNPAIIAGYRGMKDGDAMLFAN